MQRIPNTDEIETEKFYASYLTEKSVLKRMKEFIYNGECERIVITDTFTDTALYVADSRWTIDNKGIQTLHGLRKYFVFEKGKDGGIKIQRIL
jgi:hypothetical protein